MGLSRCLPDRPTIERLLAAAGLGAITPPTRPARRSAAPPPAPTPPPTPAPAPVALAPLAELHDEESAMAVFGAHAETLTVDARLEAFLGWLMCGTGAFAAFVADREGLALSNHNAPEGCVAAVGALGRAQHDISRFVPSPEAGSSTVELDEQNLLQVVWADTAVGRIAVGLVLGGALERRMVQRIRRLTQLAIRPDWRP
jgi:hypothetical protein